MGDVFRLSNEAITATVTRGAKANITDVTAHGVANDFALRQLFALRLANGTVITPANSTAGATIAVDIPAEPESIRLADRHAGKGVRTVYTYPEGSRSFEIIWTAILRDGGNHIAVPPGWRRWRPSSSTPRRRSRSGRSRAPSTLDLSKPEVRYATAADMRGYFAMGFSLQELYVRNTIVDPARIGEDNATWFWDELAKNAKWSRENTALLTDAHWLGGNAALGEMYGTAAWSDVSGEEEGMVMLRNPLHPPADLHPRHR